MSGKMNIIKSIKDKLSQQNNKQKINIVKGFIGELATVTLANMCIFSIPQSSALSPYDLIIPEIFTSLDTYTIILLITNSTTTVIYLALYIFEIYREFWLVNHFDYSRRYDSLHLRTYKSTYPELFTYLETINNRYHLFYQIAKYVFICNFIISCVLIGIYSYADYRTVTTFFTNGWLVWCKVGKGCEIGAESITHHIGYSYYNTQNLSFNRIDARIKRHISQSNLSSSRIQSRRNSLSNGGDNLQQQLSRSLNSSLNENIAKLVFDTIELENANEDEIMQESHIE